METIYFRISKRYLKCKNPHKASPVIKNSEIVIRYYRAFHAALNESDLDI